MRVHDIGAYEAEPIARIAVLAVDPTRGNHGKGKPSFCHDTNRSVMCCYALASPLDETLRGLPYLPAGAEKSYGGTLSPPYGTSCA